MVAVIEGLHCKPLNAALPNLSHYYLTLSCPLWFIFFPPLANHCFLSACVLIKYALSSISIRLTRQRENLLEDCGVVEIVCTLGSLEN